MIFQPIEYNYPVLPILILFILYMKTVCFRLQRHFHATKTLLLQAIALNELNYAMSTL